jgi:D-alanyl-D-alanine carboxypeptidase
VRGIVEALEKGRIDRALFTSNANFYFTETALTDIRNSLAGLGKLKSVTLAVERLRGGMTFRVYHAEFEKRNMTLSTYWMPDGKIEQFMVEAN